MTAIQTATRDGQVARHTRTHRQHHRVEVGAKLLGHNVHTDFHARAEAHAFNFHLRHATINGALVELEIGNPIAQQPADARVFFEERHAVARACELLRGGHPGRAAPTDSDGFARLRRGRLWRDPPFAEPPLDNLQLDVADRNRFEIEVQRASRFARRGANPPGELGEIVGLMQDVARLLPAAEVDHLVEFRDAISQRTTEIVAERNPAIHAPFGLGGDLLGRHHFIDFAIVTASLGDVAVRRFESVVFEKSCRIGHAYISLIAWCARE